MQLFISNDFLKQKNVIKINDKRIVDQIRKVLRGKTGYVFCIQNLDGEIKRYKVEIKNIGKEIEGEIIETIEKPKQTKEKTVVQSILNKVSKMEIIVQKLSEIGISNIFFIKTNRSKFEDINDKKIERFNKIALEATEQSFGWKIPKIEVIKSFSQIEGKKTILDFDGKYFKNLDTNEIDCLIIGPEGGFDEKDYESIGKFEKINLGEKVLRAETASIIGGFIINA